MGTINILKEIKKFAKNLKSYLRTPRISKIILVFSKIIKNILVWQRQLLENFLLKNSKRLNI